MNVKDIKDKYKDYVVEMRRYFHQYPELSYQEFETTKRICEELDKMGIEYENTKRKTTNRSHRRNQREKTWKDSCTKSRHRCT